MLYQKLVKILLKGKGNAKKLVIFDHHIVRNSQIEPSQFDWKKIYFLICNTTLDTKTSMFQYKILRTFLYANKMLVKFGKVTSRRFSFCYLQHETIMHLFYDCLIVKILWNQLKPILSNNLVFLINTPQIAIFRFLDLDMNEHVILSHLLFIIKMYTYNARTTGYLNISHLLIYIKGIKDTKKKLCENNAKLRKKFNKKWKNVLIN